MVDTEQIEDPTLIDEAVEVDLCDPENDVCEEDDVAEPDAKVENGADECDPDIEECDSAEKSAALDE